ncbi:MAG: tetratricopeptide repeat protein [Cyclobacteriaceae bacterium]
MRNIILVVSILMASNGWVFSQYSPKGKVPRAESMLTQGKLDNAKAEIDLAFEENAKGKVLTDGKAWYNRGRIYKAIYMDEGEFKELDPNALDVAIESFLKVRELEKETSIWVVYSDQEMAQLYSVVINEGAEAYQEDEYELAYQAFTNALKITPNDTIALLYGGTAAQMADMWDEALDSYETLSKTEASGMDDVYKTLIYIYRAKKEDNEKALEVINRAIKQYPKDDAFQQEKVAVLISMEKTEDARDALSEAIKESPDDPVLYYQLGYLYYYEEKPDEAYENFKKAVELNPEYYEANFYAGIQHFNKAAEVLKELNNLPMKEYNMKIDDYYERAKGHFENALPFLEKAYELKSDDLSLMETLESVYVRLKMDDKASEIGAKISAITGDTDEE